MLHPGEQPTTATRVMVGKLGSSRLGAVAKQAMITEIGGGLASALITKNKKQFVVVTNQRLIFLNQTFLGGPGKKVLAEVPRDQVALGDVKMGVVSQLQIAFGTAGDGVGLTFPRVDKKNADALAEALRA
jgi:hypothetical protein